MALGYFCFIHKAFHHGHLSCSFARQSGRQLGPKANVIIFVVDMIVIVLMKFTFVNDVV